MCCCHARTPGGHRIPAAPHDPWARSRLNRPRNKQPTDHVRGNTRRNSVAAECCATGAGAPRARRTSTRRTEAKGETHGSQQSFHCGRTRGQAPASARDAGGRPRRPGLRHGVRDRDPGRRCRRRSRARAALSPRLEAAAAGATPRRRGRRPDRGCARAVDAWRERLADPCFGPTVELLVVPRAACRPALRARSGRRRPGIARSASAAQ